MAETNLPSAFAQANPIFNPQNKEIFVQTLYDRVNLPVSLTGSLLFFSTPKGQTASLIRYNAVTSAAKTTRDTNLPQAGGDNNRDYLLYGLAMALIPTNHDPGNANANAIRSNKDYIREGGWGNFKIGDKQIMDFSLIFVPEINAESGVATTASGSTIFSAPQFSQPYMSFGEPIPLAAGQVIAMTITWDATITLAQSFDMYLIFASALKRDS